MQENEIAQQRKDVQAKKELLKKSEERLYKLERELKQEADRRKKEEAIIAGIPPLDWMIANNEYNGSWSLWNRKPFPEWVVLLWDMNGQLNYKGEIFIISSHKGQHGMGGMDEGSGDSVSVTRIRK